ncbi:MAG: hypothetical protein CXZ00_02180 [Acidobacteria bacterium]|nr:MAG: hypothetical protein CXZ00_02180 [Acidobacteriota bacterium]
MHFPKRIPPRKIQAVADHKERSQLVGDFLREFAVLIAALYPLETIISVQFDGQHRMDWANVILAETLAGIIFWWGIILEGRDEL